MSILQFADPCNTKYHHFSLSLESYAKPVSWVVEYLFTPSAYAISSHLQSCFIAHTWCGFLLSQFFEVLNLNVLTELNWIQLLKVYIFFMKFTLICHSSNFTALSSHYLALILPVRPPLISHDELQVYGKTAWNDICVLIMMIYLFQYLPSFCGFALGVLKTILKLYTMNYAN